MNLTISPYQLYQYKNQPYKTNNTENSHNIAFGMIKLNGAELPTQKLNKENQELLKKVIDNFEGTKTEFNRMLNEEYAAIRNKFIEKGFSFSPNPMKPDGFKMNNKGIEINDYYHQSGSGIDYSLGDDSGREMFFNREEVAIRQNDKSSFTEDLNNNLNLLLKKFLGIGQ